MVDIETSADAPATKPERSLPLRKRCRLPWWAYAILSLLVAGLAVAGVFAAWYAQAWSELRSEIAESRARGEPVWFSDLAPPPIPPEENGAMQLMEAYRRSAYTDRNWDVVKTLDELDDILRYGGHEGTIQRDLKQLAELVEVNRESLAIVREALKKPRCQFPIDYTTLAPLDVPLADLYGAWALNRLRRAEFDVAYLRGDFSTCIEVIKTMYDASELLHDEPTAVAQIQRISGDGHATNALGLLVAKYDLTDAEFSRLDDRLDEMASSLSLRQCVLGERAACLTAIENADYLRELLSSEAVDWSKSFLGRRDLMKQQAFILRHMRHVADNVDVGGPAGRLRQQELKDEFLVFAQQGDPYKLSNHIVPELSSMRNAGLSHRQRVACARLGLRVDRYYRQHGKLPENPSDVLDDGLREVPRCFWSGLPLIFKPHGEAGFMIYPPGDNGIDEGGGKKPDHQEGSGAFVVVYKPAAGQRRGVEE
ncbi:MAG: hypothetical protein HYS13_03660 [Planctomycetia bacterium]|nr:hypothetical protein [Planctomycetia bacterium]